MLVDGLVVKIRPWDILRIRHLYRTFKCTLAGGRTIMQSPLKYTCKRCDKAFCDNANLRRHEARKTPCQPIVVQPVEGVKNSCRYCGRQFASHSSMYRHIRQNCKIANSEKGVEKLLDHTLQRQNAELLACVDKLADIVEKMSRQLALAAPAAQQIAQPIQHAGQDPPPCATKWWAW